MSKRYQSIEVRRQMVPHPDDATRARALDMSGRMESWDEAIDRAFGSLDLTFDQPPSVVPFQRDRNGNEVITVLIVYRAS